jgi:hypothetical protein
MLSALSLVLREQERCCRRVSLVDVAMAIKASFVAAIDETHELNGATRSLEEEEMRRLVHDACDSVRREFAGTYVYEKDVQPEDYKAYFLIIEEKLASHVSKEQDEELSFFDTFCKIRPGVTRAEFGQHRSRLEYLGRIVAKRVGSVLEEHL